MTVHLRVLMTANDNITLAGNDSNFAQIPLVVHLFGGRNKHCVFRNPFPSFCKIGKTFCKIPFATPSKRRGSKSKNKERGDRTEAGDGRLK